MANEKPEKASDGNEPVGLTQFFQFMEGIIKDKEVRDWLSQEAQKYRTWATEQKNDTRQVEINKMKAETERLDKIDGAWLKVFWIRIVFGAATLAAVTLLTWHKLLDPSLVGALFMSIVGAVFFVHNK